MGLVGGCQDLRLEAMCVEMETASWVVWLCSAVRVESGLDGVGFKQGCSSAN